MAGGVSLVLGAILGFGCSESGTSGGGAESGGTTSAGGSAGSSGGAAQGGSMTVSSGGAQGGSATSGGAAGSGPSSGGSSGSSGNGGSGGSGGSAAGSANGGSAGSGGTAPIPTTGCGATAWPESGETHTLSVGAQMREFIVAIPGGYDASTPLRVVFAWHGMTGTAQQIAGFNNYYGLRTAEFGEASTIFVAAQGLLENGDSGNTGWWNTDGNDVEFVDAMVSWLGENYCVDQARIFSIGFSFGGMFSHFMGCERSNVFRAIAPIAGSFFNYYGFGGPDSCPMAVPAWIVHGSADEDVTPASGMAARDVWLSQNGCDATTTAVEPSPCVAYDGCETPVHWCVHPGDHMVPSFVAEGAWAFFSQY
jgi:poly(3-hydroxybutyrate) depolymerase